MAGVTLGSVTSYNSAIVGAEERFRPQQRIGSNEWWGLWWGVWGGGEETPHIVVMVQSTLLLYSVDIKTVWSLRANDISTELRSRGETFMRCLLMNITS